MIETWARLLVPEGKVHVFRLLPSMRTGGMILKMSSLMGPWVAESGFVVLQFVVVVNENALALLTITKAADRRLCAIIVYDRW